MIVVDASVLANALTDDGPVGQVARRELADDLHWVGPGHLLVETFAAVRGRWLGGKLEAGRATDALAALTTTAIELVDIGPLVPRMWELRANVSGYDAAYLALAESMGCPLLTADARLARVPGRRCDVKVAAPAEPPGSEV